MKNIKESIKKCYNNASELEKILEARGDKKELEKFKIFVSLADEGYIDVDTMKRDYNTFFKLPKDWMRYQINLKFNEIEELDFEKLAKII
jgi:hypothetical protein